MQYRINEINTEIMSQLRNYFETQHKKCFTYLNENVEKQHYSITE